MMFSEFEGRGLRTRMRGKIQGLVQAQGEPASRAPNVQPSGLAPARAARRRRSHRFPLCLPPSRPRQPRFSPLARLRTLSFFVPPTTPSELALDTQQKRDLCIDIHEIQPTILHNPWSQNHSASKPAHPAAYLAPCPSPASPGPSPTSRGPEVPHADRYASAHQRDKTRLEA